MCAVSGNSTEIWRTKKDYKRRQGAVKALNALLKIAAHVSWLTGKKEPGALPYVDKTK